MKEIRDVGPINVTGYLFGVYDSVKISEEETGVQPFLIRSEGIDFFPIFSTKEKLDECLKFAKPPAPVRIKQIQDHHEFLSSVMGKVRLVVDPWITPEGNTRFVELRLD